MAKSNMFSGKRMLIAFTVLLIVAGAVWFLYKNKESFYTPTNGVSQTTQVYEEVPPEDTAPPVQVEQQGEPVASEQFSRVYSLGVLQHTPDVEKAFKSLLPPLCNGGHLCVDYYCRTWKSALLPKYWLRPITTKLPKSFVLRVLRILVPLLYPITTLVGAMPLGHILKRLIPIADPIFFYERQFGKTRISFKQRVEWSLLDTLDWLTPAFDNPQTELTVARWFNEADMLDIEVLKAGHLVGRGRKP